MSLEINHVTPKLHVGHTTVGATAVRLTALAFPLERGIHLRAPGAADPTPNAKPVWIGNNPGVTADSAATGGYPLAPGDSVFLLISDPTLLYVISTAAGQDVAWLAQ
jgi:hypothetical protein